MQAAQKVLRLMLSNYFQTLGHSKTLKVAYCTKTVILKDIDIENLMWLDTH